MPRGGKRDGAGRKPGGVSQAKRELAAKATEHADAALQTLREIAANGQSEAARVSASIAILDRAYGRPPQAIQHTDSEGAALAPPEPSDTQIARALALLMAEIKAKDLN
jgi:hypothetical protein